MNPSAPPAPPAAYGTERRAENLAFVFQEVFTVAERLRSNRQPVTDPNIFRQQVREALKMADAEARKRGYDQQEIQLAIFAAVAFLDESILNLRSPVFADWPRQPLQEEYFGHHVAGEVFFQHLNNLVRMNDSQSLADLLEMFQLCMLLGFAGRYSIGNRAEIGPIVNAVGEKIARIRRSSALLSPDWQPPPSTGAPTSTQDPWVKRLLYGAIGAVVFAVLGYVLYYFMLDGGIATLQQLALGR